MVVSHMKEPSRSRFIAPPLSTDTRQDNITNGWRTTIIAELEVLVHNCEMGGRSTSMTQYCSKKQTAFHACNEIECIIHLEDDTV